MLRIWGRTNSLNVQKALMALEEIGRPYARIDAGLAYGVNDTPAFRAMNPNGLVPVIDDEGFVLWESNAIVRYLASAYAPGVLWPLDARERAGAERWMDWQLTLLLAPLNAMFVPLVRNPGSGDPAAMAAARSACGVLLPGGVSVGTRMSSCRNFTCSSKWASIQASSGA